MRNEIERILKNEIKFNSEFDFNSEQLKDEMKQDLILWCESCEHNLLRGHTPSKRELKHLYVFFKKIGNSLRAILVKEKNGKFIELYLINHKEYDDKRKQYGFKKTSYYKS